MAFSVLDSETGYVRTLQYTIDRHQLLVHVKQLRIRCEGVQRMSMEYGPDEVTIVTFLQRIVRK